MPTHLSELIQAIATSFPGQQLAIFLDDRHGIKLAQVAQGNNYTEIVYALLEYLDAQGTKADVLREMVQERPNNKRLKIAVERALSEAEAASPTATLEEVESDIRELEKRKIKTWFDAQDKRRLAAKIVVVVLACYAVFLTLLSSIPLSMTLDIERVGNFDPPRTGHSILYDDYYYGVNRSGDVRISVHPVSYIAARTAGKLTVRVAYPSGGRSPAHHLAFVGVTGLELILLPADASAPGSASVEEDPLGGRSSLAEYRQPRWSVVTPANAANEAGGRLYVQRISLANQTAGEFVDARLTIGKSSQPLLGLGPDLIAAPETRLNVRAVGAAAGRFQFFFELARPALPSGATIQFQGSRGFFSAGYGETFALPSDVPLGKEVEVKGSQGSTIVVQLAHAIEVVFFERLKTASITEQLVPQIVAAGFAPRLNNTAARIPGEFNVIYAGTQVPNDALRKVLKIAFDNGIPLRLVQTQLQLRNGLQNQIQFGSNSRVACLPVISPQQISMLTGRSEAEFKQALDRLPEPACQPPT